MAWKGNTSNTSPNNFNNDINYTGTRLALQRETQVKRAEGFPDVTMGLYQIDETILNHINNTLSPSVVDNGVVIKVPTIIASPERWESIKKHGILRDQNGKLQKPIIIFRRSGFTKNEQIGHLNRYLTYTIQKRYSDKNQYDQFSVLNKHRLEQPVTEYFLVTMPDHITITYEFIIWTDSIEQNNEIIQLINFSTSDYWGEKTKYKFRTEINDYSHQYEVPSEQERVIKTTFNLTVHAHLLTDRFETSKSTVQNAIAPKKVIVTENLGSAPSPVVQSDSDFFVNPNKNAVNQPAVSSANFVERTK